MASAEGDFEAFYRQHHREILAYCVRRLPPSEALDATAQTFIVAWRRFDEIPPGNRALTWLYGVAYRVVGDEWRSQKRRARLLRRIAGLPPTSPPEPDLEVFTAHEHGEVVEAVNRLGSRDREILLLATWEELSPNEIAETLGISRAAVDQRFSRAKRRLARLLGSNQARPGPTISLRGGADA